MIGTMLTIDGAICGSSRCLGDEPTLHSYMAPVTRWLRFGDTPAMVWQQFSPEWDPEFVAYVERMAQEAAPAQ
jgi:hypothetical protein